MIGGQNAELREVPIKSRRFFAYFKKAMRHRYIIAIRDYDCQIGRFPIEEQERIESVPAPSHETIYERHRINTRHQDVFLRDEQLANAIEKMAERFKEVLILSAFLGYSSAEIADMLNLDRETVNKYRQMAYKHLRNALRRETDE